MAFEIPRKAILSYSSTGHVPETPRWAAIEVRHDIDPARFNHNHPTLAGLFTRPDCLGELPVSPFYDFLRRRYEINPARFTHYHPFLGRLLARDHAARLECDMSMISTPGPGPPITLPSVPIPMVSAPPPGPVPSPGGIAEPPSLTLLAVGFILAGLYAFIRR